MTFLTNNVFNKATSYQREEMCMTDGPSAVPPTAPATFGSMLKFLRRRARLTQSDLSIAVGYSEAQISRLEQNQRLPDLTTLAALFVPALAVDDEPELVARLLELAASARGESLAGHHVSHTTTRQQTRTDEYGALEAIPLLPSYAVARPQILARLRELLAHERRVAICGLGGVGKTTLAATLTREYAQERVLWVTLTSGVNTTIDALLRQFALFLVAQGREQVLPLLQNGDQPVRTLDQQIALLGAALCVQPVLVCLDNVHLAQHDAMIMQVLNHIVATTPTRMVLTSREDVRLSGVAQINVAGLERAEGRALIERLWPAQHPPLEPSLANRLLQKTGGSPMLLRLALGQLLHTHTDGETLVAHLELEPQVASYLFDTALRQLSAPARQLAALVAVFRQPVNLYDETLIEWSQIADGPYDLATGLADLQRFYLLEHPAQAALHPLIQDHLYAALIADLPRRKRLHTIAAQWLEQVTNDVAEAAHHYAHAGKFDQAVDVLTDQGAVLFGCGQAGNVAEIVDDLLKRIAQCRGETTDLRRRLLLVRGDVLLHTVRSKEAEANYREALALAKQPTLRAQIVRRLAMSMLQRGAVAEALEMCQQTNALLAPADTLLRAQLAAAECQSLMMLSRYDEAIVVGNDALARTEQLLLLALPAVYEVQTRIYSVLGVIARIQRRFTLAHDYFQSAFDAAGHTNMRHLQNRCRYNLASWFHEQDQFDVSLALFTETLDVAHTLGDEYIVVRTLHNIATSHHYRGELALAQDVLVKACDLKRRLGDIQSLATSQNLLGEVMLLLGQVAEGRKLIEGVLAATEQTGESWLRGLYLETLGFAQLLDGDTALAETTLRGALELPSVAADARLRALVEFQLAQVLIARNSLVAAQELLATPVAAEAGNEAELKWQLARGMLALAQGENAHAAAIANIMAERAEATGLPLYLSPANQLLAAVQFPPPLSELPRMLWVQNTTPCHTVESEMAIK